MRSSPPTLMHLREVHFSLESLTRMAAQKVAAGLTALGPIHASLERQTGHVLALIEEAKATERRT